MFRRGTGSARRLPYEPCPQKKHNFGVKLQFPNLELGLQALKLKLSTKPEPNILSLLDFFKVCHHRDVEGGSAFQPGTLNLKPKPRKETLKQSPWVYSLGNPKPQSLLQLQQAPTLNLCLWNTAEQKSKSVV